MKIQEAVACLEHALKTNRLAHGYIVEGALRDAAAPLAEQFLLRLFCERGGAGCGECRSCKQVMHHTHADILWVEPEKKSRKFGTERVRAMLEQMTLTAYAGSWKVCVIVGADRLGADSSNIMLKTLEEPPGKSLFLLLTDSPQMLLPTVVSRCQRLRLTGTESHVPEETARRIMEILATGGDGRIEAAYGRAGRLGIILDEIKKAVEEVERAALKNNQDYEDVDKAEFEARVKARYLEERAKVLRAMLYWYRDMLMAVSGVDPRLWFCRNSVAAIRERCKGLSLRQALANLRAIDTIGTQLQQNMSEPMVLANALGVLGIAAPERM